MMLCIMRNRLSIATCRMKPTAPFVPRPLPDGSAGPAPPVPTLVPLRALLLL